MTFVNHKTEPVRPNHPQFIDPEMVAATELAELDQDSNQLQGRVVQIMSENGKIRMVVDVGLRLTLVVSRDSYEKTRPLVGADVGVHIPPEAIQIIG